MTDKKLSDEEIIKNLKFCEDCSANINIDIIDLITRQQAEIERLKQRNAVCEAANRCIVWQRDRRDREIEELHSQIAGLNIYKSKIKAEAYKEFAERMKHSFFDNGYESPDVDFDDFIDTLLKEMVGDDNA